MSSKYRLTTYVSLPAKFSETIQKAIDSEILVAQKKWAVTLTEEQRLYVSQMSRVQLEQRVSAMARVSWSSQMGSQVPVSIADAPSDNDSRFPSLDLEKTVGDVYLTRNNTVWSLTETKEGDDSIHARDFAQYYQNLLLTWVRTATFYAVGSYSDI